VVSWYLRLIDSGITQLKAQRHSRNCNESTEEELVGGDQVDAKVEVGVRRKLVEHQPLLPGSGCRAQGFGFRVGSLSTIEACVRVQGVEFRGFGFRV